MQIYVILLANRYIIFTEWEENEFRSFAVPFVWQASPTERDEVALQLDYGQMIALQALDP